MHVAIGGGGDGGMRDQAIGLSDPDRNVLRLCLNAPRDRRRAQPVTADPAQHPAAFRGA